MHPKRLTHDLNDAQREAVVTTTGPVCILAGAGTGKTRVITRRVAYAIATGVVDPGHVLVVTFTEKAAGEMRGRLSELGFPRVSAATFHAAARRQLVHFWPRVHGGRPPEVLDSKASLLVPIQRTLPGGYRFTAFKDLADEIEWAKARRLTPERYPQAAAGRQTPIPPDLMASVFERYEQAKERAGRIDFEDMLTRMLELMETREDVADEVRGRYRWFSVDEYQDTNPLQEALLEAWVGDREDLAVVGDEDQTIYSFTGASSAYLTGFTRRWPEARLVRLEQSYRSTPQVIALANRLLARAPERRTPKRLVPTRPDGPAPRLVSHTTAAEEQRALVAEICRLLDDEKVEPEEIAVLVRVNAHTQPVAEALAGAGIPYQVRGVMFFRRPEVRRSLSVLRGRVARAAGGGLVDALEGIWYEQFDFRRDVEPEGGEARERHAALVVLLGIAQRLEEAAPRAGLPEFLVETTRRAEDEASGAGGGVNLLTYHRAKGLEFDAVLLSALEEGTLPVKQATDADAVAEERRLLYVGITRARVHLWLSWAARRTGPSGREGPRKPSRFLDDLRPPGTALPWPARGGTAGPVRGGAAPGGRKAQGAAVASTDPVVQRLRAWRTERARTDGVPPYVVFNDRTLLALADRRPRTTGDLLGVEGFGPAKADRYGTDVLRLLTEP